MVLLLSQKFLQSEEFLILGNLLLTEARYAESPAKIQPRRQAQVRLYHPKWEPNEEMIDHRSCRSSTLSPVSTLSILCLFMILPEEVGASVNLSEWPLCNQGLVGGHLQIIFFVSNHIFWNGKHQTSVADKNHLLFEFRIDDEQEDERFQVLGGSIGPSLGFFFRRLPEILRSRQSIELERTLRCSWSTCGRISKKKGRRGPRSWRNPTLPCATNVPDPKGGSTRVNTNSEPAVAKDGSDPLSTWTTSRRAAVGPPPPPPPPKPKAAAKAAAWLTRTRGTHFVNPRDGGAVHAV